MRQDPLAFLTGELNTLREQGLYRRLRVLNGDQSAHTSIDHRSVVNLSSNNYLGLTTHPRLREQAIEATRRLGVGSGSVRPIAGGLAGICRVKLIGRRCKVRTIRRMPPLLQWWGAH